MTVRQLLNSLDSREISEWIAYFNLSEKEAKASPKMTLEDQFKTALRSRKKR